MMPNAPEIVLIGAGGHARVLLDTVLLTSPNASIAILDANPGDQTEMYGVPIVGGDDLIDSFAQAGTTSFIIGVAGARDNTLRRKLFIRAANAGLKPLTIIHPSATISKRASIGPGCQILPGAIVNANAELACHVIVNSGAIVEHDCRIGDHAHIATGARLAGGVTVGPGAHIGAGSVTRQLIVIGDNAVVGAGAVVVSNVLQGITVAGVPAKELTS